MGRKEKGKLDILVKDENDQAYLMIECKTWGMEYEKEKRKMLNNGGQLFSYYTQDKAAQYLCLYSSSFDEGDACYTNEIIPCDSAWKELNNTKEIFSHWNKNFKDNGVFDDWSNPYNVEIKALTRGRLKELTADDSGKIFNQFAEILRHNVVSDKPNAFNKIFNLFLCKIVDEDRNEDEELAFQWLESDTDESLQKRLNDLYRKGMKTFLTKEVTDYSDNDLSDELFSLSEEMREKVKDMFTRIRLHKNNEFAFKEVFDEKSFNENAIVVREVVELLQPYQIRYGHKQQFLGDFFELLLSTGIKQEAGQFFTPVPIAKFIISSMPIKELIQDKIKDNDQDFLPYIIDYAAGSGHFLTEAMDEVQKIIESIDCKKFKQSTRKKFSSWSADPFNWAEDYVYGIEADYRLVKTAKVSCFLNGDGLAKVIHGDGLDSFQHSKDYKGVLKEFDSNNSQDNCKFDILVANPPYSVSAFKNTVEYGKESFSLYHRLTDDSSEIECLFIERAKQLLKPNGYAGIILPSSILSNYGIYEGAREILLKHFYIKAISEFGANTFMATGTKTVALFLEKRPDSDFKKIEASIDLFFNNRREATVNGIEKAFSKYVKCTTEDASLKDYITLINKLPNSKIKTSEEYLDYKLWFNNLSEIESIKNKKAFKEKNKEERDKYLENLFYEKVFSKEKEKMLYFFLAKPQKTLLVKTGEKKAEKEFLGYEFSNRRGHEGIKMYRDNSDTPTTKLYDDKNLINNEKANSYIYHAFLGNERKVHDSLSENVEYFNLVDLIDFDKIDFGKVISLNVKKKVQLKAKYKSCKLSQVTTLIKRGKSVKYGNAGIQVIKSGQARGGYEFDFSEKYYAGDGFILDERKLQKGDLLLNSSGVGTAGRVTYFDLKGDYVADSHISILRFNQEIINPIYALNAFLAIGFKNLESLALGQSGQVEINNSTISNFKIPVPPISVQNKIISDLEKVDKKNKRLKSERASLVSKINNSVSSFSEEAPILSICSISKEKINPSTVDNCLLNNIGLENIESDTGKLINFSPMISSRIGSIKNSFKKGDVLYGKLRPYLNKVWIAEFNGICSTDILVLDTEHPHVLKQILLSNEFVEQSSSLMKGVSLPRLQVKDFMRFKIYFPKELEINKTNTDFAAIEKKIEKVQSEIESIPEEKRKILKKHLE